MLYTYYNNRIFHLYNTRELFMLDRLIEQINLIVARRNILWDSVQASLNMVLDQVERRGISPPNTSANTAFIASNDQFPAIMTIRKSFINDGDVDIFGALAREACLETKWGYQSLRAMLVSSADDDHLALTDDKRTTEYFVQELTNSFRCSTVEQSTLRYILRNISHEWATALKPLPTLSPTHILHTNTAVNMLCGEEPKKMSFAKKIITARFNRVS